MNKAYLAKIVNDSYVHPAPQMTERFGDWVEVIISIDADHVAYLTMPMDAYEQLTEEEK